MTRRTGEARSDDALGAAINDLLARPQNPLGLPVGPSSSFVRAAPGQINLIDASKGDVQVMLPQASRENVGQLVAVKNVSSQRNFFVTTICQPNDQIDGFTATRRIDPYGTDVYLCYSPYKWTRIINASPRGMEPIWNYLDGVLPAGVVNASGTPVSAISWWQFNGGTGSLTDRSPVNANDLTITGTERYATVFNHKGLSFDGSTVADAAGHASYRITGALTIELVCCAHAYSASTDTWIFCSTAGETEATNNLYQFQLGTTGALSYFSESGAGVDATVGFQTIQPIGVMQYYAMTRDSDGDVTLYVNGRQSGDQGSLVSPTGGTSSALQFGGGIFGTLFSARLTAAEFTAAQVFEAYRRIRGEA